MKGGSKHLHRTVHFRCFWLLLFKNQCLCFFSATWKNSGVSLNTLVCSHCGQWWQPDNRHVRLRPKRRPSARLQSVLHRRARGKRLSRAQIYLLDRFRRSSSVLVRTQIRCRPTDLLMYCTALQHIVHRARQHRVHCIIHPGSEEHERKARMYLQRIKAKITKMEGRLNPRVNIAD